MALACSNSDLLVDMQAVRRDTSKTVFAFASHVVWMHFRMIEESAFQLLAIIVLWHAHRQQALDLFSAGSEAA